MSEHMDTESQPLLFSNDDLGESKNSLEIIAEEQRYNEQVRKSFNTRIFLVSILAVVSIMFVVSHRIIFRENEIAANMSNFMVRKPTLLYEETYVGSATVHSNQVNYNPYSISALWNGFIGWFSPRGIDAIDEDAPPPEVSSDAQFVLTKGVTFFFFIFTHLMLFKCMYNSFILDLLVCLRRYWAT